MSRHVKKNNGKKPTDKISRGEATILLEWIVDTLKKPFPRGGFYHFLHRTPDEVAREYNISVTAVLNSMRRELAD